MYESYLVPSLHFNLQVDAITDASIKKLQKKVTRYLKRWLNLPRCANLASIFHPEVCDIPYLPHTQQKAKLQLLAQVHRSTDPLIHELESIIDHPSFAEQQCIPLVCTSITSSLQPVSTSEEASSLLKKNV